jgi:hypothetical protein
LNEKMISIVTIILVISLIMLACSFTTIPTSQPASANSPVVADTPGPTNIQVPTSTNIPTNEPTHRLYASFTSDGELPVLILQPNGEKLGISRGATPATMTGVVWASSDGKSVVIYTDMNGKPKSAVVEGDIILYSNYSNSTVDVTIIHPSGKRELYRSVIDTDKLNRIKSFVTPAYSLIAFSPQQQDILGYVQDALYALEIGACIGAATALTLEVPAFIALGTACASPLLSEVTLEGKASNLDVGGLDTLSMGLDIWGCGNATVGNKLDTACIRLILNGLRAYLNNADNTKIPTQPNTGKKKSRYP